MNRDERIAQIRAQLREIDATINALFHELDDLEAFPLSVIRDSRQLTIGAALAADNLPS